MDLCGKPVLCQVIERAQNSSHIDEGMVVTGIGKVSSCGRRASVIRGEMGVGVRRRAIAMAEHIAFEKMGWNELVAGMYEPNWGSQNIF